MRYPFRKPEYGLVMRDMRRSAILCISALVASCAVAVKETGGLSLSYQRLPVDMFAQPGPWQVASILSLSSSDPEFGGMSDLATNGKGGLVAISDRGGWFGFQPGFDPDGKLARISDPWMTPMLDRNAVPLSGKQSADAEGLAALPGGGFAVSFERDHRILAFPATDAASDPVAGPDLSLLPANEGVEALAVLPTGDWLVLAEGGEQGGSLPAFLGRPGAAWRSLSYPFDGEFRPTGLTIGPQGVPYVLERAFSFPAGPRARILRLTLGGEAIGTDLVAKIQDPIPVDNAEGILWLPEPAPLGSFLVISDDNFFALQKTLIWQLLPVGAAIAPFTGTPRA